MTTDTVLYLVIVTFVVLAWVLACPNGRNKTLPGIGF